MSGLQLFKSNPYLVATYTGVSGPAAYSLPDSSQPGTSTSYPTMRQTSVIDPNSHTTTSTDSVICGVAGTSDTGCYGQTLVLDANGHQAVSLTGGLGKANYKQMYTGSSTYTLYATTIYSYNAAGDLLSTKSPDGTTVTTIYDARGQQTNQIVTINGTNYQVQGTYNDAGQLLTETYPTGETVTPGYSSTGWLTGLATSAGGTTTLASNLTYGGLAGAAGQITSMSLGNGTYSYSANYDTGIRLTGSSLTNTSSSTQLYQTQPTYDAVDNVVGVQTSVGGQTDTQQFCYDDLDRLTWAGANGTPPCSGQSITAGTLTGAQYQQSNSYNVDGGLVSGPAGSYTYGDSSHPHAVTTTSNGYSAAYDAAGNLICRALTTTATCSGSSSTGQHLTYDAEGQLSFWQNQPTSPTQTVNYLYDGSGTRVAMQSTVNGTTTLTAYIGSIEEVQTSGSSTQTTTYYSVGGKRVAADVNGTFYYFGYDALGSQVAVLNSTGNLVGAQLYGPYGASRYSTGTLPTSIGFTGQRTDSVTGLDYYNARYYDPVVGQFLSEDSVQGNAVGMDPYAYVGGNPESYTDPTGYSWSNDGAAIGGSPVDWGGSATGGGNGGNVGIGGAALLAAAAAAGSGGSGGGSGSHGGTSSGSSYASNVDITDNWAQQLRQIRAYEAKQDRARAAAQSRQNHPGSRNQGRTSPADLAKEATDAQEAAKKLNEDAGTAGAASNVKAGDPSLPDRKDITAHHAGGGKGAVKPVISEDGEVQWIPDTGPKYYGTCGGSEICEAIAEQAVTYGTDDFPTVIDIVEQQVNGRPACPQCQYNAKMLARALGRIVRLFTLAKGGGAFNGPPYIYYP